MTRTSWLRSQLRITWHLPAALAVLAVVLLSVAATPWVTSHRPRVVRLRGTHREIGLQHGRLLRAEIRALYDAYVLHGLVEKENRSIESLTKIALHYDPFIPAPLREELHGIAEGAGVRYEQILVMNTFADALLGKSPRFCSAVAVHGNGGLLVGRNLDWVNHDVAHRSGVIFVTEAPGERRVLSVGWPGIAGVVTGMNDRGVVVTMNMAFSSDSEPNATPSLLRIREVLDHASNAPAAVSDATAAPRTMAMNWMVADAAGASVVELTGHRSAVRPMTGSCAVTTNYFESLPERGGFGGDRSATLRGVFAGGTFASIGEVERALLRVAFIGPSSGVSTIQSVVFDPKARTAHVAIGKLPAPAGRFYPVEVMSKE
jgi:predicted choloylglycine hydrolase